MAVYRVLGIGSGPALDERHAISDGQEDNVDPRVVAVKSFRRIRWWTGNLPDLLIELRDGLAKLSAPDVGRRPWRPSVRGVVSDDNACEPIRRLN
jgi:hypothetical protein